MRFAAPFAVAVLVVGALVGGAAVILGNSPTPPAASADPQVVSMPTKTFDPADEGCPDLFRTPIQTWTRMGETVRYFEEFTRTSGGSDSRCPEGFGVVYDMSCGYGCVRRVTLRPDV